MNADFSIFQFWLYRGNKGTFRAPGSDGEGVEK